MVESITYKPIGHVDNRFSERAKPDVIRECESRIYLDDALRVGLKGLEPGRKILVVFHCHKSEGFELMRHPRGDTTRPKRGIFSLCAADRPNPIGVTEAELLAIEGSVLTVRGLDAINGTPVLDIKPA